MYSLNVNLFLQRTTSSTSLSKEEFIMPDYWSCLRKILLSRKKLSLIVLSTCTIPTFLIFFFHCSSSYGYKKPYGTKYDSSHVDNTIKKVGEYADAQEDYKKQSLNIKYSYDAVPTEYDYVEKYGWGRPTTIGSLYNGYGYGNQYPQQYGYGHQHSYGYKRPSYGYRKPSYRKFKIFPILSLSGLNSRTPSN